jgi:hypothetical protein
VRLIYAIWNEMVPYLDEADEAALRGFVTRQTGVSAPEFLTDAQADRVIEGLKAWKTRLIGAPATDAPTGGA